MPYFFNISQNELIFLISIGVLLFISLILLISNLSYLQNNKHLVTLINAKLIRANHLASQLEACQIENISLLKNIFEDEGFPLLNDSFERYVHHSNKLYQNKWMLDPKEYFNIETLLTSRDYNSLHNAMAFKQLSIGLFISAFSLIFPFIISLENSIRVLPFALLPASITSAFFFLYYHKNKLYIHELNYNIKLLQQTLSRRLPVFSDLAGSAVLVDAFIQYDKQMAKSVQRLSTSVSSLLNQEMVNAISETLTTSIENTLSPTLTNSHHLLLELSKNLTKRQEDGMVILAEHFSKTLSEQISQKLEPFYYQINAYARSLDGMVSDMNIIKNTLFEYQQQASQLDHSREEHMRNWEIEMQKMQQAINEVALAQTRLAIASDRLTKLQGEGEHSLTNYIQNFASQINDFKHFIELKHTNLSSEHEQTRTHIENMLNHHKTFLDNYTFLSQNMITSSENINDQASKINIKLEDVANSLDFAIKNFKQDITATTKDTIDIFDKGLSEISDRLSTSISEVKQILPQGPTTITENKHPILDKM